MKSFLEFLMRFANLNRKFVKDPSYTAYHLDKILVKVYPKPLLTIDVQIQTQEELVEIQLLEGEKQE
jgi:hypothetical protein